MERDVIPFTDNSAHIETDFCTQCRIEEMRKFIEPDDLIPMDWLDVGEKNFVGQQLFYDADNTLPCDFNDKVRSPRDKYDVIFCFEVFEHVMNPLNFLRNIGRKLPKNGVLYLSTPVHNRFGFMFNETCHFAEYKVSSVVTCLEYAGFKITKTHIFKSIPFWRGMKQGDGLFRTFLRVSSQETQIHRAIKI